VQTRFTFCKSFATFDVLCLSLGCAVFLVFQIGIVLFRLLLAPLAVRRYLAQDRGVFEDPNESTALNVLALGFTTGHPLCHGWELFDAALLQFPDSLPVAVQHLRFSVLYSSDTQHLIRSISHLQTPSGWARGSAF
jgi:hypothetical protein